MNIKNIIKNLDIPLTRITKRIPKNSFENNLKLTTTEKKYLKNDIDLITLEYSLVQNNIKVPAILNDEYNYSAINIISIKLNNIKNLKKIANIINKSIPTANLLIFKNEKSESICLFAQLKRINQADKSKIVLLEEYSSDWIDIYNDTSFYNLEDLSSDSLTTESIKIYQDFFNSISYKNLIKFDLKAMYQDIIDKLIALEVAKKLNYFSLDNIEQKKELLAEITELEKQNNLLKKELKKTINFSDKTNLNIKIQANKNNIRNLEKNLKEFKK